MGTTDDLRWASSAVRACCPLTSGLLAHRGRLENEVAEQVRRAGRPPGLTEWARAFLAALAADEDLLVADIARLELALTGSAEDLEGWTWNRDPHEVVKALVSDPDEA